MVAMPEPNQEIMAYGSWKRAAPVGLVLTIFAGALAPAAWFGRLGMGDPALHILAFAGLMAGWRLLTPALWRPIQTAGLAAGLGLATEIAQIPAATRSFAWEELGYDWVGIAVGVSLIVAAERALVLLKDKGPPLKNTRLARKQHKRSTTKPD